MNATATEADRLLLDSRFVGRSTGVEWPTVGLGMVIVSAYVATTWFHYRLPATVTVVALAVVTAWWSSFQHELIHGHPFVSQRINDAIGVAPLLLWLPYGAYKSSHLRHHRDPMLTDPHEDPESFYVDPQRWEQSGPIARMLLWCNRTFAWRLIVSPLCATARFTKEQMLLLLQNDRQARKTWVVHLPALLVVCVYIFGVAQVPVWLYLLGVWGGTSLMRVRSFAEHMWTPDGRPRTAFVDGIFPFGVLFLFNNYHSAHHARPSVPWYQCRALARELDSRTVAKNGAGYYKGYREVFRLYFFRPFDVPVHPQTETGQTMRQRRSPAIQGVREVSDC
jgi:fatty acid desaturase